MAKRLKAGEAPKVLVSDSFLFSWFCGQVDLALSFSMTDASLWGVSRFL